MAYDMWTSARFWTRTIVTVVLALSPTAANAQTYESLYAFTREGGQPAGPLLAMPDGRVYGTAVAGGRFGLGSVFVLTPNGDRFDFTNVWEFSGSDGGMPDSGVIRGTDGNLYGTTWRGPNNGGTIFRIDGFGALTTLHAFGNHGSIGGTGPSGLVQGADGNLYGRTSQGGSGQVGTVFRMTPSGLFTTIHHFTRPGGAYPSGRLILGSDGWFYGTTSGGGVANAGTVFKIDASGSFTTLHHFGVTGTDGGEPLGLVQASDGHYYGTTGRDTIFRIDSSGSLTTLHRFTGADGTQPWGGLTSASDGNLYGTTYQGGASGGGTVFRMSTAGSLTTIFHLGGAGFNGSRPLAPVVVGSDGALYGTTTFFAIQAGRDVGGSAFRVTMSGEVTTLHVFVGAASSPNDIIQASDGLLYGTTLSGRGKRTQTAPSGTTRHWVGTSST